MDWLLNLLGGAMGGGIVVAAVGWLGRRSIDQWLQTRHATAIARLRSELRIHETAYAKLYERRAEVIAELHRRLSKAESVARRIGPDLEADVITELNRSVDDSLRYWMEHRLFFDRKLCDQLDDLHALLYVTEMESREPTLYDDEDPRVRIEKIVGELCDVKAAIEQRFREMLGIELPDRR